MLFRAIRLGVLVIDLGECNDPSPHPFDSDAELETDKCVNGLCSCTLECGQDNPLDSAPE